jgi:type IV pilus assembly protein PilA
MRRINAKGLTLVELAVVLGVVSAMVVLANSTFNHWLINASRSRAKNELSALYSAEKTFYKEFREYWERLECIGYRPKGKLEYTIGFNTLFRVDKL